MHEIYASEQKGKKDKFPFAKSCLFKLIKEDLLTCHNTDEAKITKCAANFLKFVPERIGGGGRGDN